MHIENDASCFCDPNDSVLINSSFSLNVIILFRLVWYFRMFVGLYKPCYEHFVTELFISRSFIYDPCFGSHFLSSLSSFPHFLGCQTHTFEDDNSKDVWLSLKTLKWRVARLVDVGLQVFLCFHEAGTAYLCFKLSKLGLNAI